MEESPSLFSSFPDDIVLNVIARVSRRYHPILCCVSKKFRSIVRSSELHKTRSLLGKDSFYVYFQECLSSTDHWFSLTEDHRLVSIPFPSPPELYSAALMVGSEIYFVGGDLTNPSRSMWILDSRSGKLRQGPNTLVATSLPAVGIVDEKIYIIGGCGNEETQAQVFDPKTQTWNIAENPSLKLQTIWMSVVNPSLDRRIYARSRDAESIIVYDPKDGNCEIIKLPHVVQFNTMINICMIDNVLYTYNDSGHGELMWYNPKEKEWRVVHGLNLGKYYDNRWFLSTAENNGKLALLWRHWRDDDKEMNTMWCAMISLRRSGVSEVQGRVEWSDCILSNIPSTYYMRHCLGRTD